MTFVRFMYVIWQDFQNTRSNRRHIKGRNNDEISLIKAEQLPALSAIGHLDPLDAQSGEVLIPEAVQAELRTETDLRGAKSMGQVLEVERSCLFTFHKSTERGSRLCNSGDHGTQYKGIHAEMHRKYCRAWKSRGGNYLPEYI